MVYTKQEKQKLERVISVFAERLKESDAFDLVWSDKVGYVLLDIAPDYDYSITLREVRRFAAVNLGPRQAVDTLLTRNR